MKAKKKSLPVFEADSHILDAGDMRPEYDFSKGVRGKHTKDLSKGYTSIVHHPDGTKEITHYRRIGEVRWHTLALRNQATQHGHTGSPRKRGISVVD